MVDFVDRIKISSDIANGLSYITIYNRVLTWKKGNKINFFRIHGQPYIRIDENKVNQDYLGDILEIESPVNTSNQKKKYPRTNSSTRTARNHKSSQELESKPEPSKEPKKNTTLRTNSSTRTA